MNLKEFFTKYNKVAIAFSGGVDSAYLLYAALENKADLVAYYVKSDFQPQFEFEDAKDIAKQLNAKMKVIEVDALQNPNIAKNPEDRCYYCKHEIFSNIISEAKNDGFTILLDGTNYSDSYEDRPGMKAKDELKVLSPLRECGLTKEEIRRLSKEAGLPTWNKPSYSCLATRIQTGDPISKEKLAKTERAEDFLMSKGLKSFRVRDRQGDCLIQVMEEDFIKIIELRQEIIDRFSEDYKKIHLDLEARK